ncbi:MAG: phosphatidate cytidylyltransferase [Actinomycetota bacterium]
MSTIPASAERPQRRPSALPVIVGVSLGLLALLTAHIGPAPFLGVVVLVLLEGSIEMVRLVAGRLGLSVPPLLGAAAAVAFPLAAFRWGEPGILTAAAVAVLGIATVFVLRGLRPAAVSGAAVTLLPALYVGFLGSYPLLLRSSPRGAALVTAFLLMLAAYHLGRWLAGHARIPSWVPGGDTRVEVAGVLGCLVAAAVAGPLMSFRFAAAPFLGLGIAVGVAAALGSIAMELLRRDLRVQDRLGAMPGFGGLLMQLGPVLLAGPAFFYGFRLYLT